MDLRHVIDDALEISVVGSFTRVGFEVRRRLYAWADPVPESLRSRTALVTGPTSGIGRVTAGRLASLGARVVLVGRSRDRLLRVQGELTAEHRDDRFPIIVADMSSKSAVRAAVERITGSEGRLDIIIDNAGTIYPDRTVTDDGIEATLATSVVNPFMLIDGLLPMLRSSDDARVVSVVTGGMYAQPIDLDDLEVERMTYDATRAYARAKRAQAAMAREWSRRLSATGIRVNAMHPGWADTPSLAKYLPGFYWLMKPSLRTAEQGADTIVWLATEREAGAQGGQLFLDRAPRPFDRLPATRLDLSQRRMLWDEIVRLADSTGPS